MEFSLDKIVKTDSLISTNVQSKMINLLKEQFTQEEQEWYVSNLYMYMHYHPTNDFPINLEHVYKMMGFSHKKNAKRTLENNFTKDEDYKIALLRREQRKNEGGYNDETIMLNVDTFKNLCMIAKTEKGKAIRKYYVKLENIYNKLIQEEMQKERETASKLLEEKEELLIKERETASKLLEEKEELSKQNLLLETSSKQLVKYSEVTYEEISKAGHVYIFSCDQPSIYKCGRTKNVSVRVKGLQTGCVEQIHVLFDYPTNNDLLLESAVHHILDRYRCNSNREHFRCDLEYMKRIVTIVGKVLDTLKSSYQTISENELMQRLEMKYIDENKHVLSYPDPYENSFSKWLDENIIYSEGDILQLNTICEDFTGRKVSPRSMFKFRKELEQYIAKDVKLRDKRVCHRMQDSSYNGQKYKGYLHLTLK